MAPATKRLQNVGIQHLIQDETTCCYAKSTKVWASEPDGLKWEWYRVIEDAETFGEEAVFPEEVAPQRPAAEASACCSGQAK